MNPAYPQSLAIVLPAFNEEAALRRLVPRIDNFLETVGVAASVIIVDDGSTDATSLLMRRLPRTRLHYVQHHRNCGFGRALNTGLCLAAYVADAVVTMDADDTHDPQQISQLLSALASGYDVVIASRYATGAQQRGVPWTRRYLSGVLNRAFATLIAESRVRDFSSGFRIIRTAILRRIIRASISGNIVRESGFAATLELLLACRAFGATIAEVPIDLSYDRKIGPSAMRVTRTLLHSSRVCYRALRQSTDVSACR